MNTTTTPEITPIVQSEVDRCWLEMMGAELLEQRAYERYEQNPSPENWIEHQRAIKTREIAHSRRLDALVREQEALAQL